VKRNAVFWRAVQAVIARAAAHWGQGLVGYSLLTLSRDLAKIALLAPESSLLGPEAVAYEVINNFFFCEEAHSKDPGSKNAQQSTHLSEIFIKIDRIQTH
jgi:hypothetical protein